MLSSIVMRLIYVCALCSLTSCGGESKIKQRESSIEKGAQENVPDISSGYFWIEVNSGGGDWIKVGLIFGFLGNKETCDRIAEELTTPPGYPLLERVYRCTLANGTVGRLAK